MNRSISARVISASLLVMGLVPGSMGVVYAAPPITGAVFTTVSGCGDVNQNIYSAKGDVYLNGGPARPGAAGMPSGNYYVRVTEPSANDPVTGVLGTSVGGPAGDAPVNVTLGGDFFSCYQLTSIVRKITDSTPGYDSTNNNGGEYKVWVCQDDFSSASLCKTDNFKVKDAQVTAGWLSVIKFYDANANGLNDDGDFNVLDGWQVRIDDGIHLVRLTPVLVGLDPLANYTVTESTPNETNWLSTTGNPVVNVSVAGTTQASPTKVTFGNVCLGEGGGLTLGFWSNKNGQAIIGKTAGVYSALDGLNLRNTDGSNFDPTTYAPFRTWILGADAVNMANMLSAQLAAMKLNVMSGRVSGASLVYAPGVAGASALGFISVDSLMTAANNSLGTNVLTLSGNPARASQEVLKNALDNANNNKNFVQLKPCDFSFAS
jgi:hypothetical protein